MGIPFVVGYPGYICNNEVLLIESIKKGAFKNVPFFCTYFLKKTHFFIQNATFLIFVDIYNKALK